MGRKVIKEKRPLIEVSLEDSEFRKVYEELTPVKKDILGGKLEFYIGSAHDRAVENVKYARQVIGKN